jgi:hypothetical protein
MESVSRSALCPWKGLKEFLSDPFASCLKVVTIGKVHPPSFSGVLLCRVRSLSLSLSLSLYYTCSHCDVISPFSDPSPVGSPTLALLPQNCELNKPLFSP